METINDVLKFLNKLEESFYLGRMDFDDFYRLGEVLARLFQDVKSEKLESMFHKVREIEILFGAGDWCEISDIVKILRKNI